MRFLKQLALGLLLACSTVAVTYAQIGIRIGPTATDVLIGLTSDVETFTYYVDGVGTGDTLETMAEVSALSLNPG